MGSATISFKPGRMLMSRGIAALISDHGSARIVRRCLDRHLSGDWGEMCEEDLRANEEALREGARLFSSYQTELGKIWVITEADRAATTILLPEEY
jgi:hypothetical protein